MLLIKLWNYLKGYVIIRISGEYTERLLNQAALKRIYLWDVRRVDQQTLVAKIGVRDFKRLCRLSRKTRSRIHILRRAGLLFLGKKLLRRKVLIAGGVLFILAIYFLSSMIWSIEVIAEDPDLKTSVERDLKLWGIDAGKMKHTIDKELYTERIISKYSDVAWAQIYFKGSKLMVELVKKNLAPDLEDDTPGDIIATKDGIIEEIIPFNGEAMVKPGDTVLTGDVLISGKMLLTKGHDAEGKPLYQEELVPAKGMVKARVWYQRAVKVPLVIEENLPTGAEKKQFVLYLGDWKLTLPWGKISFSHYEVEVIQRIYLMGKELEDYRLDILLVKEINPTKRFLGVEEASTMAEAHLNLELKAFEAENITQKRMEYILDSEGEAVIGSLTVEVIEDIGKKTPFS